MRELFILITHLLTTVAKLARPGGLGKVAAESVALKHQLLIMKRGRRRAPMLSPWDRLLLGILYPLGVAQTPEQDRRNTKAVHAFAFSPGLGEAQVSAAL